MSPVRSLERRQITVLFCDVVGWSSLAQQVDPEELADIIRAYRRRCATIVSTPRRIGSPNTSATAWSPTLATLTPTRTPPNGRYALRSISSRRTTERRRSVEVRIGIATGGVVIGDLLEDPASAASSEPPERRSTISAVGEPPNLAARLQSLAEAGAIVVSDQTQRLCRGVFEYQNLGRHELKGFAEPVQAWRVLRESAAQSRFHALRASNLTPLVNRRAELEEIARLWESAKAGNGSTLLVSGEPGIGKSRLADEVTSRLVDDGTLRLRYSCSSYLKSSPLAPVIRQLPRAAGFSDEDSDGAKARETRTSRTGGQRSTHTRRCRCWQRCCRFPTSRCTLRLGSRRSGSVSACWKCSSTW